MSLICHKIDLFTCDKLHRALFAPICPVLAKACFCFFHGVAVVHEQVARDKQERTDMPPSILLIIATKQNCLSPTVRYPSDSQAESRNPLEKSERLLVERDITFETHHGCSLTLAPPSSRLTLIKFCTLKYQ